ncbi:cell division protein ZapA [Marinoscillum sp. MHG1-6]|uniref:cell division protein ZapA n=1 Tax=Marinoscillum sp. MHG1-6 TaxID=2959627 RepID=UPI0021585243|nr:cell division protein ZapA [Marinoscillum sp. MHG1-6]
MAELSIKLKIGNREYPMKVKAEDEERIRRAGKMINEKIRSYKDQFGIDDYQDLLAMVAFDFLVDKMKSDETIETTDEFALNQIRTINQLIVDAT